MQLGLIGLGKMGGNMRERLRRAGHEVIGFDRNPDVADVRTLPALVKALEAPRVVWVMVPAGDPTRETVAKLAELLEPGDLVIDGGNSRFTDDFENAKLLGEKKIGYVDCGVSGGIWGLENGYGLMCGGDKKWVTRAMPIFYELLEKKDIVTDVPGAFKAWSRGTVVRSWLLDLMVDALEENPHLDDVSDYTNDSGEGRWTVEEAIALSVPMPVISASLFARFASRQSSSPTMQAVAALRGQFGGHQVMTIAEGEKLRQGDVPAAPAKKAAAKKGASRRSATKQASKRASATASQANVGAAKKAASSGRASATTATDMADSARGQKRAAKKTAKKA